MFQKSIENKSYEQDLNWNKGQVLKKIKDRITGIMEQYHLNEEDEDRGKKEGDGKKDLP